MAEAFVSLVTNDNYAKGALVLGQSLRNNGTMRRLALMITREVSPDMRHKLDRLWDELVLIEELDSGDSEHLSLLSRPELGVTFSKIHAWRLTQYRKCVFLDADTMVLQNIDELFDREELSAAPDIGWPDCFNSGVFVFEPSMDTLSNLLDLARQQGSFDGGDQGLLNTYWGDWSTKDIKYHLPFTYNVTPNITYGYAPAFQRFGRNIKIIHFIGPVKPWQHYYNAAMDTVILSPGTYASEHASQDFLRQWWQLYHQVEQPHQSQSYDWSALPWDAPPPSLHTPSHYTPSLHSLSHYSPSHYRPSELSSHHTPSHYTASHHTPSHYAPSELSSYTPSHHTFFTTPHIVTHTHHSSTGHPTMLVTSNHPSLVPIHTYHSHADIIHTSDSPHVHNEPKPSTPSYLTDSYVDAQSHVSLSFYSHDDIFDKFTHSLPVESMPASKVGSGYFCDDEELHESLNRRLRDILLDDVKTPRISFPHSYDLYWDPPTSACSSQAIDFPFSQPDYNSVSSSHSQLDSDGSTESDANSLPESTISEYSISPQSPSLSNRETWGSGTMSDSVLPHVTTVPSHPHTHTLSPPTILTPSSPVTKESSGSSQEQDLGDRAFLIDNTTKSVEQVAFESGQIDFHGRDSFNNIQEHIEKMMK